MSSIDCECCGPIIWVWRGASTCRRRWPTTACATAPGPWALGYDRSMTPETPGSHWNEGLPDFDATYDHRRHPTGMGTGHQGRGGRPRATTAGPFDVSPRHALRRAIADWQELGLSPVRRHGVRGLPLRARRRRWLATPRHARRLRLRHRTRRSTPTVSSTRSGRRATRRRSRSNRSTPSTTRPQFEFTLRYTDALRAADDGFLFKVLAREVAHRHGLLMTFMGKPLSDRGGSGLHFNISLRDDDE